LRTICLITVLILAAFSLSAQLQGPAPPERRPGDLEIYSERQESRDGVHFFLGEVEIRQDEMILRADEVAYDENTGEIEARGNVHYVNPVEEEDLYAERFVYNVDTGLGTFYDVYGTVASEAQAGPRMLTTDNPFYIEGQTVEKTEDDYIVRDGFVTNCESGHPWWSLKAPKTRIKPNKAAIVHRGVFRLKNVPVFYFPYFKKSLERTPRQSGFLTPSFGNSSRFGLVLGQSYYWAVNRSYDATVTGTLLTDRGIASQVFARGRPTQNSYFTTNFFGVEDRGKELDDGSRLEQGGASFSFEGVADLGHGFRGVADINVLSSLEFRQAFTQTFQEAVFSQLRSIGFASKNFSTFSLNAAFQRDENFQSIQPDDTVVVRKLPSVEFNSRDRQIAGGPVPLWVSFDSAMELVSRSQPLFETRNFVQRGDFYPRVSSKFRFKGFHFRPTFGARQTYYGQSREGERIVGRDLTRSTREFSLDLAPPSLARIYEGPERLGGGRIKHVIEPRIRYRFVDGVDDFDRVVRFDERDIISNTNEAEFQLTNRFYWKNGETGQVREVLTLDVWQRRFFDPDFGGAIVPGRRNVLQSSLGASAFAFLDEPRSQSPIITSLRVHPSFKYSLEWRNDYDPVRDKLVATSVNANMRQGIWNFSVGHTAQRAPSTLIPPSNQLTTLVRVGDFNRRGWNFAFNNIYDFRQSIFLFNTVQATYNTDCCGFSFEWKRFAIGRTRNENQFRVALTIANIGSFGTLQQRERLF